ncbi:MAG: isoamylase [Treponema sp.]|jgi:hypothetical protein|nr:isoamylase [Treponema sp.]
MKRYITSALLVLIIGNIEALDTDSYQFIDHLLGLKAPAAPELFEDGLIFTAPSSYRSVGIAFAHEGFSRIYWFQKLMAPQSAGGIPENIPRSKRKKEPAYQDSGVLFHAVTIPPGMRELEYRLIIEGLWTVDPLNPASRVNRNSGIRCSLVLLPELAQKPVPQEDAAGTVRFHYNAPPGELITLAGDFNGWDPFMYELIETAPGQYSIDLPLPPGTYHYVFYHRGRRNADPLNPKRVYTRQGEAVSELRIPLIKEP